MQNDNLLSKIVHFLEEDTVDNLIYGTDEDPLIRHARRKRIYGVNRRIKKWIPGYRAYKGIKATLNDNSLTKREKIAQSSFEVVAQIAVTGTQVGVVYGLYRLVDYLYIQNW